MIKFLTINDKSQMKWYECDNAEDAYQLLVKELQDRTRERTKGRGMTEEQFEEDLRNVLTEMSQEAEDLGIKLEVELVRGIDSSIEEQ